MKVIKKGLNKKKGFTLVELSIVLVIIGLLVSGILVAQSLIETAQLHGFVRQIEQYRASVDIFKSKYRQLPGDSTRMEFPGDGDGVILGNVDGENNFDEEIGNFWYHMSIGGAVDEDFNGTGSALGTFTLPDNVMPEVAYGEGGQIVAGNSYFDTCCPGEPLSNEHVFWVIDPPSQSRFVEGGAGNCGFGFANNEECDYPFTPIQALAFDSKTDDSKPGTGNVQAAAKADFGIPLNGGSNNCVSSWGNTPTHPNKLNAEYVTSESRETCALIMRMFPE